MLIDLPESRLWEVHEVACYLKSSVEFVRREIREGRLAAVRLGARSWRVRPVDVKAWEAANLHPVRAPELHPKPATIFPHQTRGVSDAR